MKSNVRVKICGLTRKHDVEVAIAAGADSLGFVSGYTYSPRNLTLQELKQLVSSVPPFVSTVVVTPTSNKDLNKIIKLRPSYVQLYSDLAYPKIENDLNVIQTVRPSEDSKSTIERAVELAKQSNAILFDTSRTSPYEVASAKDGEERRLEDDWKVARRIKGVLGSSPLILGGGLTEKNVRRAVQIVHPFAVDVSSGVERSPGIKDEHKIFRFIENAKNASS